MDRTISSVLITVGVLLVLLGFTEAESVASEVSKLAKGNSIEPSTGLLIAGIIVSAVGIAGYLRNRQKEFFDKSHS